MQRVSSLCFLKHGKELFSSTSIMYLRTVVFCSRSGDSQSCTLFSQQRLDQSTSTLTKMNHPIPSINDCDTVSGAESIWLRWSYTITLASSLCIRASLVKSPRGILFEANAFDSVCSHVLRLNAAVWRVTAVLHSPPADLVFWEDDDKQENKPDVLEK